MLVLGLRFCWSHRSDVNHPTLDRRQHRTRALGQRTGNGQHFWCLTVLISFSIERLTIGLGSYRLNSHRSLFSDIFQAPECQSTVHGGGHPVPGVLVAAQRRAGPAASADDGTAEAGTDSGEGQLLREAGQGGAGAVPDGDGRLGGAGQGPNSPENP